jgi:hypothetical protein
VQSAERIEKQYYKYTLNVTVCVNEAVNQNKLQENFTNFQNFFSPRGHSESIPGFTKLHALYKILNTARLCKIVINFYSLSTAILRQIFFHIAVFPVIMRQP